MPALLHEPVPLHLAARVAQPHGLAQHLGVRGAIALPQTSAAERSRVQPPDDQPGQLSHRQLRGDLRQELAAPARVSTLTQQPNS